ncbi:MAG TPA: PAS domain S-box protein, partial [Methylococcaceae bacterium]|nr:PAS domain S-box protein [Methylococcaceae bacterium]
MTAIGTATDPTLDEVKRLKTCLNDLITVLALPAMWSGGEPRQVIASLLDVLLGILRLDFAYVKIKDSFSTPHIEMVRVAQSGNPAVEPEEIGEALKPWLEIEARLSPLVVRNPAGAGDVSIAPLRLGFQNEIGWLVTASRRSDFPTETERVLLTVAANQAVVVLQAATCLSEQRRLAEELDEKVAQRTRELQRSEFYLQQGQLLSQCGSWSFLLSGECDYWSPELYRILGFDPSKGIPALSDYIKLVHPDDRSVVEKTLENMIAEGIGCDIKKRIVRTDGALRVIRCVGMPVFEKEKVVRFVGTLMDVTEHEKLTQELRRSEFYLQEGERLARMGSWSLRPGGIFDYWSPETFLLFSFDPAKGIPTLTEMLAVVHQEDRGLVVKTVERMFREGVGGDITYRVIHPEHGLRIMHSVGEPVREEAKVTRLVGNSLDITERKLAENAVRAARARFEGFLDIADDAIISIDSHQRITLFNQGAERVFGYTASEVIGRPLDLLIPQHLGAAHRKHIEEFAQSPEVARPMGQRREVSGRRRDGSEFPAEASISKLDLDGELMFAVILRDITERKRAEEALRRSEAYLAEAQKLSRTGSFAYDPGRRKTLYWSEELFR